MGPAVLSLCSGVGGLELGVSRVFPGSRVVGYVEREAFACALLVEKMEATRLDPAPIWTDLLTFDGRPWRGKVDLIASGIPCQPYSLAGKRRGNADERALWPELVRIVGECDPALVFVENTPDFLRHSEPLWDELARLGYTAAPPLLSTASEYGSIFDGLRVFLLFAKADRAALWNKRWRSEFCSGTAEHRDDRVGASEADFAKRRPFATAGDNRGGDDTAGCEAASGSPGVRAASPAAKSERRGEGRTEHARDEGGHPATGEDRPTAEAEGIAEREPDDEARAVAWERARHDPLGDGAEFAATHSGGRESEWGGWLFDRERQTLRHHADGCDHGCRICWSEWEAESPACRVDDGFPDRLDRLYVLGNAVVPRQAEAALREQLKALRAMGVTG